VREILRNSNLGKKHTAERVEKSRLSRLGYKHTEHWKNEARIRMSGKKFPPEFGEAISKKMMGNKNSTNKPKPKHWKENLIAKMTKNFQEPNNIGRAFLPNYNETACEYFDWLNKFMGWDGQYATHKGEKNILNYFVDYYEPLLNIVIEWDEAHHKKQVVKDTNRQNEIKNLLKCRFFRYDVLTMELNEV
jgi:very-short-patch-repair endonuclease